MTYRRHLKSGNIRFAIGGSYSFEKLKSPNPSSPQEYVDHRYSYDARIGWEFTNEINRKGQVFYGFDFRPSYNYYKNDYGNQNAGYSNGAEEKSQIFGFAPLLGFRFKLSKRLSLVTEANFSVNYQERTSRRYFTPLSNLYPQIPDDSAPKTFKTYTSFNSPLFIIITFDI